MQEVLSVKETIDEYVKVNKESYIVMFDEKAIDELDKSEPKEVYIKGTIELLNLDENDLVKKIPNKINLLELNIEKNKKEIKEIFGIKRFPCMMKIVDNELDNFSPILIGVKGDELEE